MKTQKRLPALTTLTVETHHFSGIGSIPSRSKEVRITLELARLLYNKGRIAQYEDGRYTCWAEQLDPTWVYRGEV